MDGGRERGRGLVDGGMESVQGFRGYGGEGMGIRGGCEWASGVLVDEWAIVVVVRVWASGVDEGTWT